jgi:hypothetical protein
MGKKIIESDSIIFYPTFCTDLGRLMGNKFQFPSMDQICRTGHGKTFPLGSKSIQFSWEY